MRSVATPEPGFHPSIYRYAIDVLKLGPDGRRVGGSDLVVTNWYGYDEPVYAPADGQIVRVVDDLP